MTTATAISSKIYSVEEYFALEENSDIKHEFVNGKIIVMPGESKQANLIASNCNRLLFNALDNKGFFIYQNDVRTIVREGKIYRYPDVVVAPDTDNSDTHNIKEPVLLIEVTSDNSSKTDHDDKLKEYNSITSVQYYLIISQYEMMVEVYSRQSKGWHYDIYTEGSEILLLPKLQTQLSLNDMYYKVKFAENISDIESEI